MNNLKNKIVLITGGSSGIGMAAAILFAKKSADIIITYKGNKKGAEETLAKITKLGRKVLAIKSDLTDDKNAKKVIKKFGRIDVLVNNAGRYIDGDEWNLKSETWIKSLKQNLVSAMSVSKYATEIFKKQGSGIIVNVASKHGISGHADSISYGAAKAGIINITQSYAKLMSSFGGRANSVSPSAVNAGYWLTAPKKELEERLIRRLDHKLIDPNGVAKKIVFLVSDEAKDINGQNFIIE
jgi:3-oxoacyl-[acyl-carrier protein] reductase